ncbi:MAG: Holliday junction resolvase RuvX [Candidatus Peribacteria bacterium]|nr:MAG: Holliday junction resolvase RuvX [Candidatus Peribacteria bacterium]
MGLAYSNTKAKNMVVPIGYIMNDKTLFFNMADVMERYRITSIVVGYPKQHKSTQQAIDEFCKNLLFVNPDLKILKVDEEYSSVEANEKTQVYTKDTEEDTLAAMILLERYLDTL